MLLIEELYVKVHNKSVLNGLNLFIDYGEIHVIMGPNGSGKSTLSSTLAGHKNYKVSSGRISFKKKDLLSFKPEERAGEGLFIAFQYPIEIPGISNNTFLQTSINSIRKYRNQSILDREELHKFIKNKMKLLKISSDLLIRSINSGFSGGEKKLNDILQMILLEPDLCVLDETDSGLDIDVLKIVMNNINLLNNKRRSFIIITHYPRILNYIIPKYVHIFHKGKILKSGDLSLAKKIEDHGYGWVTGSEF